MAIVNGADSDAPQESEYRGREIWGIYTPGWPRAALGDLGRGGIRGVLPITVAPAAPAHWWSEDETGGYALLEGLVRVAMDWGVPSGSPLCLDVEESLAEQIGSVTGKVVAKAWATACRIHGLIDWSYGGETWHASTEGIIRHRWLAKWPLESGETPAEVPEIPSGFDALQYAGNVQEGRIDLDLFNGGLTYLGADLQVAHGPEESSEPMSDPATDPTPTETSGPTNESPGRHFSTEADAVESAVDAEVSTVTTDENAEAKMPVSTRRERIHADLETLLDQIKVHLGELDALDSEANSEPEQESPK
jgi:hypothetical protein